jgi:hypothetical protein
VPEENPNKRLPNPTCFPSPQQPIRQGRSNEYLERAVSGRTQEDKDRRDVERCERYRCRTVGPFCVCTQRSPTGRRIRTGLRGLGESSVPGTAIKMDDFSNPLRRGTTDNSFGVSRHWILLHTAARSGFLGGMRRFHLFRTT